MRRTVLSLLVAVVSVWSCAELDQDNKQVQPQDQSEVTEEYVPGTAEIKFTPQMAQMIESSLEAGQLQTKSAELNCLMTEYGVTSIKRLFPDAGEFEERSRREGLDCWYVIKYDERISRTKAQASFEGFDGVEIFEPERSIQVESAPVFNDPRLAEQWHYYNYNQTGQGFKNECDVNVIPVWKEYTTGDPSVIVGVTDTGIDYLHEDLAANYVGGYNFVSDSKDINPADHGTHVAGTISAVNNNGLGVSGLAGGDYAKGQKGVGLLSCQIFAGEDEDGSGSGASAIKWAADHGAVISQNSWGLVFKSEEDAKNTTIPAATKAAIDYFIKYAGCDNNGNQLSDSPMKGGVVIFSAGNDNRRYNPICEYDPVISVGAVGGDFNKSYYSNYGDWVDICAPGGDAQKGPQILSTMINDRYGLYQGTSMSCPHVSGVAALVVSYCGGRGYTNENLRAQLIGGANGSSVRPAQKIGPLVDALGAITYGQTNPPSAVKSLDVKSISNFITVSWPVTVDAKGIRAYGYKVYAAKDKSLLSNLDYSARSISGVSIASVAVGDIEAGDTISATFKDLDFDETYYVTVVGYSYNGCYSELSKISSVKTKSNNAPEVKFAPEAVFSIKAHQTVSIPLSISDPDGHSIKIKFTPGSSAATLEETQVSGYTHILVIAGPKADSGRYNCTFEVTDSYGLTTTLKKEYNIEENHKPEKIKDIDNILISDLGGKVSMDLNDYFTDPDGETLSYSVSASDKSVVNVHPVENQLTITSMNYGLVDVAVTGSDARGESVITKFQVLVKDPSKPVELSSTAVKEELVIRTGELRETTITILSQTGKVVYQKTDNIGAFYPAVIDVRGYAPGVYKVEVKIASDVYTNKFMKI